MRIANEIENGKLKLKSAGVLCVAAWMLATMPGIAQNSASERTGVSHPDSAPITVNADDSTVIAPTSAPAKPSAAIPETGTVVKGSPDVVYGPYVPYRAPGAVEPSVSANAYDPDANMVTAATAGQSDRRLLNAPATNDEDAGIVTHVPSRPGEIPDGTLVKVRLNEDLSTLTTTPGTKFTAQVSEPVLRDGVVIVPVGSVLEGRVTWVRGGKRIGGAAAIHLEPRTVTLPDGAQYVLRARVIDTDRFDITSVDSEGTILRKEHPKRTAAVISLSAGSGLATGALIGGVPGAVIGAGVGAGVSTVVWLKQDRQAELNKDLGVVFSLTEPMSVTPVNAAVATVKADGAGGE
jgi:hypothetical protein